MVSERWLRAMRPARQTASRPVVRCAAVAETALSVCGDHGGHVIPAD